MLSGTSRISFSTVLQSLSRFSSFSLLAAHAEAGIVGWATRIAPSKHAVRFFIRFSYVNSAESAEFVFLPQKQIARAFPKITLLEVWQRTRSRQKIRITR